MNGLGLVLADIFVLTVIKGRSAGSQLPILRHLRWFDSLHRSEFSRAYYGQAPPKRRSIPRYEAGWVIRAVSY